ncbi:hypothetical protein POF45_04055 [Pseudomonas sp. 681]|uniref:Uncharacterized protein n=1 Tax=Pseudomonas fungipugnans TaxID=3024217 RepID=A0ABT6QI98_9PSED|nr:hypothetical protein [Pseudomonas sp. 681]MDI2590607.1 hypothetical protein [Pseudomonas sp. 681]
MSHDQAVSPLASGSETNIVAALVSIGLNEQDKTRAQTVCVEQLDVGTESVAALARRTRPYQVKRDKFIFLARDSKK